MAERAKTEQADDELEQRTIPIDALQDNPRNPRQHPEDQITKLVKSVNRFGQTRNILVRKANQMIVAGHGLRKAMAAAGYAEVKVFLWDVDQQTADEFMLADNAHAQGSRDDFDMIASIIREVDPANYLSVGYDQDQVDALLEAPHENLMIEDFDTSKVADRFWISIRGPLPQQAAALDGLKQVMAGIDDVDVELGTTDL